MRDGEGWVERRGGEGGREGEGRGGGESEEVGSMIEMMRLLTSQYISTFKVEIANWLILKSTWRYNTNIKDHTHILETTPFSYIIMVGLRSGISPG